VADVAEPTAVRLLFGTVAARHPRLDVLFNNAGIVPGGTVEETTLEEWDRALRVNLTSLYLCCREAIPIMKRQGRGRIVNVSSIAGVAPTGSSIAYAVSKAGLNHLTRCMAVALAPEVLVNCVAPGFMEGTRMTENLAEEYRARAQRTALLRRPTEKDDVAALVTEFCRTDSITGQTLVIDAGRVLA